MRRILLSRWFLSLCCAVGVMGLDFALKPVNAEDSTTTAVVAPVYETLKPTHKQTKVIKPLHNNAPIVLNTYCLDNDGNILACVGGDSYQIVMNSDGTQETKKVESAKLVQLISPEGKLLREVALTFAPTAINQSPDGTVFVAGEGKVAKLSATGEVLATADSPHVGDMKTFRTRVEEGYKKQIDEMTSTMKQQVKLLDDRLAKLLEKPEAERTDRDNKRIATVAEQKQMYVDQVKLFEDSYAQSFSGDQALTQKLGITAVAVTSSSVFLCCNSIEGHGYEVWKLTHEFSNPERVVDQLSGCCGQCDIQATEDNLVLAENTRFMVSLLDHEGNRQKEFGKGDRKAVDGFGSCCNPMNVRCCDNGDILTAESSIGTIKRFNKDGELIGVVGKARIGGGCKHVAVAFDESRNRYYMMNVDKSHICVLVPNEEAPEFTEEELSEKAAREGLGKKIVGEWSLDGNRPKQNAAGAEGVFSVIISALSQGSADVVEEPATIVAGQEVESGNVESQVEAEEAETSAVTILGEGTDPYRSTWLHFQADGKLLMNEGVFAQGENEWAPVRQDGNVLYVAQLQEGVSYLEYKIEFVNDNEVMITSMMNDSVLSSNRYKRVTEPAQPVDAKKATGTSP
ncbi:MAG: hypothetical protein JNL58_22345 [Planctomyces sp.]|nr:hypothetical protein [Planctomyces sp.]